MTNTKTLDTDATVSQVIRLADAGCDIVRITAPSVRDAENLAVIRKELRKKGCRVPLVADIHFTPKAAEVAARIVEKVRINPGNYVDRNRGKSDWSTKEIGEARERIAERLIPLLRICRESGTAVRIGTNHGSLSERILAMHGNTPEGMVESAMEFVGICHDFGFHDLVLSMKASNVREMTAANTLLVEELAARGWNYPIHLGVTEAGNGEEARIKSAAGIGSLLALGIGDTVRVSLAEQPVEEVSVARRLVDIYGRNDRVLEEVFQSSALVRLSSSTDPDSMTGTKYPVLGTRGDQHADLLLSENGRQILDARLKKGYDFSIVPYGDAIGSPDKKLLLRRSYPALDRLDLLLRASADLMLLMMDHGAAGVWIENGATGGNELPDLSEMSLKILQGLGLRYSKAEFVACPSCGRTTFNLFDSFNKVKEMTGHLKGLQIAVMGCIVNGPGEMGDADYGYVGAGPGKVNLYADGEVVYKNIAEEEAVFQLTKLIMERGDWTGPPLPDQPRFTAQENNDGS